VFNQTHLPHQKRSLSPVYYVGNLNTGDGQGENVIRPTPSRVFFFGELISWIQVDKNYDVCLSHGKRKEGKVSMSRVDGLLGFMYFKKNKRELLKVVLFFI